MAAPESAQEFAARVLEQKRNEIIQEKSEIERRIADLNSVIHQLRGTRAISDRPQA